MSHDSPQQPHADRDDAASAADERVLDELLAGARWPEPSAGSEQRVRDAWRSLSEEHRRTRRIPWAAGAAVAAAAVVIIAAGLLLREKWTSPASTEPTIARGGADSPAVPHGVEATSRPAGPGQSVARDEQFVVWRPAEPWELAIANPRPRKVAPVPATGRSAVPRRSARPDSLNGRVDAAVEAIAADKGADVAALAAALKQDFAADRIEQRLTPVVVRPTHPFRRSAVRLLAEVATPRATPLLASLCDDPAVRADAVNGLVRVADAPTLAALAGAAADDGERRRLIAAMLRRDPVRAVPAYLAMLSDEATAGAALAALDDVERPPVDALFARLNDPRHANRLAAARALGRINGPAVTARLAAMVRRNVNRHEALLALASSDGPAAKSFFESALASKELGASARTARAGLDRI